MKRIDGTFSVDGRGPGAGLIGAVGDFVMLGKNDWREVVQVSKHDITLHDGLTARHADVLAIRLPGESFDSYE